MIDKQLRDAPVLRVPKTDLIRVVVSSPKWNAAIGRRLIAPHPARILELVLSIEALQQANSQAHANAQKRRCVTIVQVDSGLLESACRLAVENSLKPAPDLLLVIGIDLDAWQRHGLRCSGVAGIFKSFIELEAIEVMVTRYFSSLPEPDWSLEQRIANSI